MSVIEVIFLGQEAFGGDVVSKIIEEFDMRGDFGEFYQNQIKKIFRGFGIR